MNEYFFSSRPGLSLELGIYILATVFAVIQLVLVGSTLWMVAANGLRGPWVARFIGYWLLFYGMIAVTAVAFILTWLIDPAFAPVVGIGIVLIATTLWTYIGNPQTTWRRLLIVLALRLAALLILMLTAARPSLGVVENPKQPSTLIICVDVSESMSVKDEIGGQARIDAVRKTLERCQPTIDELLTEQNVNVVIYKFGPPDFNEATSLYTPTTPADAKRSDYGTMLSRLYDRWQTEQRIRGLIIIGDGVDNGETFPPFAEAAKFGRRGVPAHTVVVGSQTVTSETKDIAVTSIECNPSPAVIKNKMVVTARVNAYSFNGTKVVARVSINDDPKLTRVEEFTLDREKNELKIVDVPTPEVKGEYKVKVEVGTERDGKIVALPGELSGLNNVSETYLTVQKEGVRILIVDQLRFEETLLRDALRSEPRFDLYEVIRQTDLQPSDSERTLLDLEKQAYDVVIIGNVNADHLRRAAPDFLKQLTDLATKKGIGVMFLGGEYSFQGISDTTLLPLKCGPIIDKLDQLGNPLSTYPAIPTTRGIEKMFRVSGKPGQPPKAGESEEMWNRMNNFRTGRRLHGYNQITLPKGGLYSVFAWTTSEADDPKINAAGNEMAPGGSPLLVGSQRGDANKGRWLAFAGFDTQTWCVLGQFSQPKTRDGLEMHHRFWRQCVLWLAHQDEEESQVYARPQYRQMKVTQEQTIRVGMKKPDGTDDPNAPLTVRIVPLPPGQQEPKPEDLQKASPQTILTDVDKSNGQPFRKVLFRAPAPGEYFVSVTTPGQKADGAPDTLRGSAKFIAIPDISDEMLRVTADPDFMQKLAVPTGGKAMRLDDLPGFLKELKAEAPPDLGKKPKYYPDWHRNRSRGFLPSWLVLFVILLGAEWGLRRLWGMV